MCSGKKELEKELNVTGEFQVEGTISAIAGRVEFIDSLNVSETSVIVLIDYKTYKEKTVTTAIKKPEVTFPKDTGQSLEHFYKTYGDSYVKQITVGAEFYAAYVFHSKTIRERTEIITELEKSGLVGGAFSGTVQWQLLTVGSSSSTTTMFKALTLGFEEPAPDSLDNVTKFYESIKEKFPENPLLLRYVSESYHHVKGVNDVFKELKHACKTVKNEITPCYEVGISSKEATKSTLNLYKEWSPKSAFLTKIEEHLTKLKASIEKIKTTIEDFPKFPIQANFPLINEDDKQTVQQFLQPNYVVNIYSLCGGAGGDPIWENGAEYIIRNFFKITKVGNNHGDTRMDKIEIVYDTPKGSITIEKGGDLGFKQVPDLSRSEILATKVIEAYEYDSYVATVHFKDKESNSLYQMGTQRAKKEDDNPQNTVNLKDDEFIIGFNGNAGELIDFLELYTALFFDPEMYESE